jgi:hypothetical protein
MQKVELDDDLPLTNYSCPLMRQLYADKALNYDQSQIYSNIMGGKVSRPRCEPMFRGLKVNKG